MTRFSIDWGDDVAAAAGGETGATADLVKERETDFEIQNKENLQMPPPSLAMPSQAPSDPNLASKLASNKPESGATETKKASEEQMDTNASSTSVTCS